MSQSQPLDVNGDSVSLDGLEQVFSEKEVREEPIGEPPVISPIPEDSTASGSRVRIYRDFPSNLFTRGFDGVEEIVRDDSRSKPIMPKTADMESPSTFDFAAARANESKGNKKAAKPAPISHRSTFEDLPQEIPAELKDLKGLDEVDLQNAIVSDDDRVSRSDLVGLLEGFVRILRKDGDPGSRFNLVKAQQLVAAQEELKFHDVRVEDKTQELEEMRRLVIEAQETIIKLLTDRVEDRARIATLETELRLLPDLQEQADRAMAVAFKTEEFRSELHKVKYELERYRFASVRGHVNRGPRSWLSRVRRWFLKAQGVTLRNYDATRRIDSES